MRQYARAEVMIANPFRESGSDLLDATLSLVVSPMVFVRRVRTNKSGKLVGVEYIASTVYLSFKPIVMILLLVPITER